MLCVPALLNHISISMGQVHIILRTSQFHMICCEVPIHHQCSPKKPPVAKSSIRQHPQHRPQQEHSLIGIVLPAPWKIDAWLWVSWENKARSPGPDSWLCPCPNPNLFKAWRFCHCQDTCRSSW